MTLKAIAIFDIDGVIRDVSGSYRRALADTVEQFTAGQFRPTSAAIDTLKSEGRWNNDWEAAQELIYRYFERKGRSRDELQIDFDTLVDFFQRRYRGPELDNPAQWTGYIAQEPVLVAASYFAQLTQHQIAWGFFSGATKGSAHFILEHRIGLKTPPLIAMHDAPSKPDPTGFLQMAEALNPQQMSVPVLYVGDTVADMQTVEHAKQRHPERQWLAVGILPPHVLAAGETYAQSYAERLQIAGATVVLPTVTELTADRIQSLSA